MTAPPIIPGGLESALASPRFQSIPDDVSGVFIMWVYCHLRLLAKRPPLLPGRLARSRLTVGKKRTPHDRYIESPTLECRDAVADDKFHFDTGMSPRPLAFLDWLPPQILAVEFEQIECTMHGAGDGAVAADQVEHGKSIAIANDSLTINQAGAHGQRRNVLPLTKKLGPARQKSFSLFAAYLCEYRAKILESAGWSQCPPERGKLCEEHNRRPVVICTATR